MKNILEILDGKHGLLKWPLAWLPIWVILFILGRFVGDIIW